MFEVGKTYEIEILDDEIGTAEAGITSYGGCKIIEVQWPCVKYRQGNGEETIVNVASSRFIRAKRRIR